MRKLTEKELNKLDEVTSDFHSKIEAIERYIGYKEANEMWSKFISVQDGNDFLQALAREYDIEGIEDITFRKEVIEVVEYIADYMSEEDLFNELFYNISNKVAEYLIDGIVNDYDLLEEKAESNNDTKPTHQLLLKENNGIFDKIVRGYLEASLFTSSDEDLYNVFTAFDFDDKSLRIAEDDVSKFLVKAGNIISQANLDQTKGKDWNDVGIDFWMTKTGQGIGFWESEWGQMGQDLDKVVNSDFKYTSPQEALESDNGNSVMLEAEKKTIRNTKSLNEDMQGDTEKLISDIVKRGEVAEKELNLIKNRINNGKVDISVIEPIYDEEIEVEKRQAEKGITWLTNLWKTPTGAERKNNPFGYREEEVLENAKGITWDELYTERGNFYVPVYTVYSDKGSFQYHMNGGEISIIG